MKFVSLFIGALGIYGGILAIIYAFAINSNSKIGFNLRKALYDIVEKGRKHE